MKNKNTLVKEYFFGFDLKEVQAVMKYVKETYKDEVDYEMYVGYGDDVMNALEVYNEAITKDEKFLELVNECEGLGDFDDEEYEEEEEEQA
jgi:hypothetical protein